MSHDGDQGFPGNLDIEITYHLLENGFEIIYSAISDTDTICNLSTRNFFNLNGEGKSNILNHKLKINADYYLPINETLLPKEYIASVKNTPMDYVKLRYIENHDMPRIMSYFKNKEASFCGIALIYMLRGMTFLYNGIETLSDHGLQKLIFLNLLNHHILY